MDSKQQYRILLARRPTRLKMLCRRLSQFLDKTQLFRLFDADRPIVTVTIEILLILSVGEIRPFGATSVRIAILSSGLVCRHVVMLTFYIWSDESAAPVSTTMLSAIIRNACRNR
jgi:hypothetical protein